MIARTARARSGITLTEILISILIMGVGLISLATLFPLGLVRLRDAARQSRSALLGESASADVGSRALLDKAKFFETYYGSTGTDPASNDPFIHDMRSNDGNSPPSAFLSATLDSGGLPICYDPLWFKVTGQAPYSLTSTAVMTAFPGGSFSNTVPVQAAFGFSSLLAPAASDGAAPNSYGLQRITNFIPWIPAASAFPFTFTNPGNANPLTFRDMVEDTFVSPEDLVMQNDGANQQLLAMPNSTVSQTASGVVPMMTASGSTISDWKYSWFFTGRQIDRLDDTQFSGDIVIVENRQIGVETQGTVPVASSEFVVDAIFGAGANNPTGTPQFFASGASRSVILRWPATQPDLEIKVGNWFADVTYFLPQNAAAVNAKSVTVGGTSYPMQRCYWYQVSKRSDVTNTTVNGTAYRQMTVTTTTPLRAQTLLSGAGVPVFSNTALFMPGVINVYSRTFYVR